jgi:hypothetical protein
VPWTQGGLTDLPNLVLPGDAAHNRWQGDHIDWACFDAAYLNQPQHNQPLLN